MGRLTKRMAATNGSAPTNNSVRPVEIGSGYTAVHADRERCRQVIIISLFSSALLALFAILPSSHGSPACAIVCPLLIVLFLTNVFIVQPQAGSAVSSRVTISLLIAVSTTLVLFYSDPEAGSRYWCLIVPVVAAALVGGHELKYWSIAALALWVSLDYFGGILYDRVNVMHGVRFVSAYVFVTLLAQRIDSARCSVTAQYQKTLLRSAQVHRELEKSQENLRMILSSISDVVFNIDTEGRLLKLFQPYAESGFASLPDDFVGKHFGQVLPPPLAEGIGQALKRVGTGEATTEFDYTLFGEPYQSWFLAKVSPLRKPDGTVTGYTIVSRNVTRRKRAELKRSELEEELQRSEHSAMLGRLAAGVAHEINNPASAVQSDLQTLLSLTAKLPQGDIPRKQITIMQRDLKAISRVTEIVAAVKGAYRPDKWHLIDIEQEIELQITLLQGRNLAQVIFLKEYMHPGRVEVCGSEIGQILLNLILNAVDAVGAKGTIAIGTSGSESDVRVSVRDDGVGIEPSARAHLFEPFFTTKPIGRGTGLGLSISSGLARRHGGKLYLNASEPGQGSEFVLEIPKRKEHHDQVSSAGS